MPLPLGEVAERSEDGEGKLGCNALSVTPWGERPAGLSGWTLTRRFQSTLPVGGATGNAIPVFVHVAISIHAPRGGSDGWPSLLKSLITISIHAPRGGSDGYLHAIQNRGEDFNPRSPWGERPARISGSALFSPISIHAPRGGSDGSPQRRNIPRLYFNPRSPWGERPLLRYSGIHGSDSNPRSPWGERLFWISSHGGRGAISIHAPRGGSDGGCTGKRDASYDFNPRSPWGERPVGGETANSKGRFQSTLPVGGATPRFLYLRALPWISIHAPRGGSDGNERLLQLRRKISIHAPRGGSDVEVYRNAIRGVDFNPRSPWGERRLPRKRPYLLLNFNPRSPWGERPCDSEHLRSH